MAVLPQVVIYSDTKNLATKNFFKYKRTNYFDLKLTAMVTPHANVTGNGVPEKNNNNNK